MKKMWSLVTVAALAVGLLVGCGDSNSNNESANKGTGKLVVYTPNSESIINMIIPLFEKEQALKLN